MVVVTKIAGGISTVLPTVRPVIYFNKTCKINSAHQNAFNIKQLVVIVCH
jgi:hypothetical protein